MGLNVDIPAANSVIYISQDILRQMAEAVVYGEMGKVTKGLKDEGLRRRSKRTRRLRCRVIPAVRCSGSSTTCLEADVGTSVGAVGSGKLVEG